MGVFYGVRNILILYATIGIVVFLAFKAFGSPFLICDPQAGVEWYEIENLDFVSGQTIPAEPDGSIDLNLAPMTADGLYNIQVRACNMWGCSADAPFSFTKEPTPSGTTNLRLVP